ncbi:GntR family transcriptional regulator [Paenibacillus frigoriresistens]|uniref:GntR family transcriptional regulator n=1 Tax=Paenibacillus alginolyticus TaxID=59839 RepID=UPI0015663C80|nr:GntR family transcriptional regulator [Paenibacillus frigoriresistens]NRF94400.1 GntR family transcriptional regulator [Paenibacillus frigoriresistens]
MELYKQFQLHRAPIMKSFSVYEQMKRDLINGQWGFGEKIFVNDLIEKFNVSRRPVMDAMKILETDGFIEIIPQSGCKVVDYSNKSAIDQLLLSSALESLSAELAAKYRTDEEIETLEEYHNQFMKNPEKLDERDYYFNYNREFHFHISSMTNSDRIQKYVMQLWDLNDFYLNNLFEGNSVYFLEQLDYHGKIIEAVKLKDCTQAKKMMEKHLRKYVDKLSEQLA